MLFETLDPAMPEASYRCTLHLYESIYYSRFLFSPFFFKLDFLLLSFESILIN